MEILIRTRGGKAAAAEVAGVAGATEGLAGAQTTSAAAGDKQAASAARARGAMLGYAGAMSKAARAAKLGAIAGGVAAAAFGKKAIDATMQLGTSTMKLTRVTGLETKTASAWSAAAELRGISADRLQLSFGRLGKQMLMAKQGSKTAIASLTGLGVSMEQVKKGDMSDILGSISDRMASMKSPSDRAAFSMNLFGRQMGLKMVPLLDKGRKGIGEMQAAMEKAGVTFDDTKSIENQIKAKREWRLSMLGLQISVGKVLLPAMTKATQGVNRMVGSIRKEWPKVRAFFEPTVNWIGDKIGWLLGEFRKLPPGLQKVAYGIGLALTVAFGPTWAVVLALATGASLIVKNWKSIAKFFTGLWHDVTVAFRKGLGWVGKQLHVSGADVRIFWQGVKNAFSWGVTAVKVAVGIFLIAMKPYVWLFQNVLLPIARRAWAGVVQVFRGAATIIGGIVKLIGGVLTGNWRQAWRGVKQIFRGAVNVIVGILRTLTAPIRAVGAFIGRTIGGGARAAYSVVRSVFGALLRFFGGLGSRIAHVTVGMFDGIKNAFKSAINWLIRKWNGLSFGMSAKKVAGHTVIPGFHVSTPDIPLLAKGGTVARAGAVVVGDAGPEMLQLPEGARVTPLSRADGAMHGATRVITQLLDGRVLADVVYDHASTAAARA